MLKLEIINPMLNLANPLNVTPGAQKDPMGIFLSFIKELFGFASEKTLIFR